MIRHIVAWKFAPEAHGATAQQNARILKERLEALAPRIQGLVSLHVGLDIGVDSHYHAVLESTFVDQAALDAYKVHPEHKQISAFCKSVREDRVAVDYLLPDGQEG